ncbi:MAG TPA: hypothetical protein VFN13_08245 [Rudaea sp.]|nr:hypothetical protein [Rudaea sp.]
MKPHMLIGCTLLLGMLSMSGCGVSAVLNDSGIDAKHDAQGNVILLDTPRMWRDFVQMTHIAIEHELAGDTHWGQSKSANEEWIRVILYDQSHREHPKKYIDYIIEQRREAGLPELVGYP